MKNKYLLFLIWGLLMISLVSCGSTVAAEAPQQEDDDQLALAETAEPGTEAGLSDDGEKISVITTGVSMRVLWTVSDYAIGKNASWGDEEAKVLLFKPLDINETQIIFDEEACSNVSFKEKMVDTADYLSSTWQTTPQELKIEDQKLEVFVTNCPLPGFDQYMRLEDGRLIVPINGVFFYFEPAVAR